MRPKYRNKNYKNNYKLKDKKYENYNNCKRDKMMKGKDFNSKCSKRENNRFRSLRLRCLRKWKVRKPG